MLYDLFIGGILRIRAQRAAEPQVGRARPETTADED
ncbi:hypothetical protein QFZ66_001700 [Streptomyces sp. B4I13]|nr:hypothetical protein [Streptomyces achromogenes]MDQ0957822.1 hypothetical protein [Streptomyces sp. B4I13]